MPKVSLPSTPIAERHGRVVLETTDGPMRVAAKYDPSFVPPGGAPTTARSGELCTTPCVVELPVGRYRFFFSATEGVDAAAGDTDDLEVKEGVQVYRRAPGLYDTPSPMDAVGPVAIILLSIGAVIAGAAIMNNEEAAPVGWVLIGGGIAGGIAGGFWAYDASRATQQDGATSSWSLNR